MSPDDTKVYRTVNGGAVSLNINHPSQDCTEIIVRNVDFHRHRRKVSQWIGAVFFFYLAYILIFGSSCWPVHVLFIALACFTVNNLVNLIQTEKISLVRKFALQTSTTYCFGSRTNFLLSASTIEDIVINEVITNQKVIYLLIVLTKTSEQNIEKIIPLLKNLKPNLECLERVYKILQHSLHGS